jgi:hypothetical protein
MGSAASVVTIVCALVTGCGSDGTDEPGPSAPSGALTARQYSQLERLYRTQLPFDRAGSDRKSIRHTIRGCREVDASDELLAAVVDGCEQLMGAFAGLMKRDCKTQEECIALISDGAILIDRLLATVEENTPVIERHVSDQECRDVLLSREQAAALEQASEAFKNFVEVANSGDLPQLATAQAEMGQATAALDRAPSSREMLRRFQRACRPVAS